MLHAPLKGAVHTGEARSAGTQRAPRPASRTVGPEAAADERETARQPGGVGNQALLLRAAATPPPIARRPSRTAVLQRKCACGAQAGAEGTCAECREEDGASSLQRRAADRAEPEAVPQTVYDVLSSPGRPLETDTRGDMEQHFGHDFSQVRVHADAQAERSARDVHADAYAVGNDIVFAPGKYAPRSAEGKQLLAHELTHTVQQSSGMAARGVARSAAHALRLTPPDHPAEREADAAANAVRQGRTVAPVRLHDVALSRDENFTPAPASAMALPTPAPPPPVPLPPSTQQATDERTKWEAGTEVLKIGIVATDEGVNFRPVPDTTSTATRLPLNTRLLVNRDVGGGWYHVVLDDGRDGYVAKANVSTDLPDADSRLYRIVTDEGALAIVKKFFKNDATEWGADERFFVNVLVFANEQRGRKGIYKPSPGDDWDATKTTAGSQIWIPSVAFAKTLKGKVSSGSLSYETYRTLADAAYAVGEFLVGGLAFIAGILHGALESVWDTLVGLVELADMVFKLLASLIRGNLLSDAKGFFSTISSIKFDELVAAGLDWLDKKWNDPSLLKRWHFRGWITGYAIAEIIMLFFTGGILTSLKAASKAGKFAEVIAKFPKVVKFIESAKTAAKGAKELEAVKAGVKALATARDWVVKVLKVPAKVLGDLTTEAIERLKKLPAWAQERFSELADAVKIRLLGCASHCMVDVDAIHKYLRELAAKGVAGAKKLTNETEVLAALPKDLNVGKIKPYLTSHPALMEIIKKAGLTDKDFVKLADFLADADKVSPKEAYKTFSRYLTQIVPSKTGNDIETFNKIVEAMVKADGHHGAALKGPMFEAFVRLHVAEFAGKSFERATFKLAGGGTRQADRFFAAAGEVWEIKHQLAAKVPPEQLADYLAMIGQKTLSGVEAKSINYLFPNKAAADLNKHLKPAVKVFYLDAAGILTPL
jgi:hypothetical protein